MKKQQGFTLIELMIVIAIVAILAAIALPAYQDYMKRSKVSEAVAAAGACKTSVAEYAASQNKLPTTLAESGCSDIATQYVSAVGVSGAGVIKVTLTNIDATDVNGKQIILTPQSGAANAANGQNITGWKCTTDMTKKQFAPASCRGT